MRILYDSRRRMFKDPFGTLTPGQDCTLHLYIPAQVMASGAELLLCREDGTPEAAVPMKLCRREGDYEIFRVTFSLANTGLYFYYFRVAAPTGPFRLFRQGEDTNMEAGDLWQVSCVPADFQVPGWAKGAVMYQIFPDRFRKSGECDLTGKTGPYRLHESWEEEVDWRPDGNGKILNNDFFGGNFQGIRETLDRLAELGVTLLYLNPICKSFSNHRYDTGDYKTPDPMLGTMEDFRQLCRDAHARGIRVILDGVFSHTGSDSLYFDREGNYGGNGAYNSQRSPWYSWFTFRNWPDSYDSWWGFETLPTVRKTDPSFIEYIITGEDSVVAHWLRAGADGFRLDVADELPDGFIALLKKRLRQLKPEGLLLGEVWEDASNKIAYDTRRRYFVDGELDSVMNYPFRKAMLAFLRGEDDGRGLRETVLTLAENYPKDVLLCCMNLLGSHDTPRILTALVDDFDGTREENAGRHLSPEQYRKGRELLKMASFLQFSLPGAPSIYYGDEAGMEGARDPFNRRPYPWGREDPVLLAHYRCLGRLRREQEALRSGDIRFFSAEGGRLGFTRCCGEDALNICINNSGKPWAVSPGKVLLGYHLETFSPEKMVLSPGGMCITREEI